VPGPGHSDRDRSVKVIDGDNGDIIISSFAGEDWRSIKDIWRADGLLDDKATAPLRPRPVRRLPPPRQAVDLTLWSQTRPITADDPVGRYLTGRGCMLPDPDADLRWLPDKLHYQTRTRWPAMIGRITDAVTAFGNVHGHWPNPYSISDRWRDVVKNGNLPKVTFHSLRHTHASALIAAGLDVVSISRRLGHASPALTLSIYAHLFENKNESDAAAIDAAVTGK
jgi:hypothetical protein